MSVPWSVVSATVKLLSWGWNMAFRTPTFNLTCSIWRNAAAPGPYITPDVSSLCNLTPGERVSVLRPSVGFPLIMWLLLPKLTDIRDTYNGAPADLVEVPAGSHRFYTVIGVDDVGKGFGNEHRMAVIQYNRTGGPFVPAIPAPVPLT